MDYSITLRMIQLSAGFTPAQRVALLEAGLLFRVRV